MSQRLLITGGTGFIGSALVKERLAAGDQITLYSRHPQAAIAQFQGQVSAFSDWQTLSPSCVFDAVINLAGSPVVGPRWSTARKQLLLDSRVGTTEHLITWLAQAHTRPTVLINGSAIGYYGCRGDEALDESVPPQAEFMSELCQQWEASANKAQALGLRVICLRLGLVFCSQQDPGGALPKLVFAVLLGFRRQNGQW
ncbi:NAD-dependent epimerase/dehydratase family protein [Deefgea sp. CFH1-16]|uniref:NAD-dependent epimerase/dehydratase family protein n=1 Tax=Deefgea sp. CFH1-16 TaxID=2675457 RepID=UPI0015F71A97|nr:NAD-dependent epimerase/dehydratase family protein [Deefgea sp. CFH1-16]MBM5575082.1 NAD-dependent epimerase/dehydratase family protein [Deefgea sp. CFH1-16]